jgi:beta-aspartyl-peptidase (threonine type)
VGCVVRDGEGRLAAATSTGGTPFRPAGRVGDSPLVGSGFYADGLGTASSTGWGEAIATVQLASRAARDAAPAEAAAREHLRALAEAVRNREGDGATAGLLLIRATGDAAWAFTTPKMARAWWTPGREYVRCGGA